MRRIAIIGGGISGLSALHFIKHRYGSHCEVTLFEKETRIGGTIGTDRKDGFISDWGPNGFLDKVPLTLEMISELGIDDLLEPANPKAENRYIYKNSKLHAISPSPIKFLKSSLLSIKGRGRLIVEPFIKQKKDDKDESIFEFAKRRIGKEAAETLIVPMVSGIFGGDARKLSLKACFPIMVEMEHEHGSLIKAMIAKKKQGSKGGPAGPQGRLTSFKNGLYTVIESFENQYRDNITTGMEITGINYDNSKFEISFKYNQPINFDAVICAAPAFAASKIVTDLDNSLAQLLSSIPYSSISVACLGYRQKDISHNLNGFGFLVPRNQGKRILGAIWTSSIFESRSPNGMAQLRVMLGGATDPDAISMDDDKMINLIHDEISPMLGINNRPEYINLFKWQKGIPQFVLGHPEKIRHLTEFQEKYPGLFFTGNAYDGIGLNDCIVRSDKIVKELSRLLDFE